MARRSYQATIPTVTTQTAPSPAPRLLLSIPDAAIALGISRIGLVRLLQRNELRAITVGERRKLVPTSELERYIADRLAEAVEAAS